MTNRVIYQTEFDEKRHKSLRKSIYRNSSLTQANIFENVNYNVYHQMGCNQTDASKTSLKAGKLTNYKDLLVKFSEQPNLKFLTALELSDTLPKDDEILCQIRHDVDADIVACLPMAKIEANLGIKSTYYLLHTAAYYGIWKIEEDNAIFERNECLAEFYLQLQELGHEVAIHTDPLHVYQNFNADGSESLINEITWLRSIGLQISGSAPHNNPQTYGASNSSIFTKHTVSELIPDKYLGVIKDGKWAALGQIDSEKINLKYESDEVYEKKVIVDFISMTSENKWWRMYRNTKVYEYILDKLRKDSNFDATAHLIKSHPDVYPNREAFMLTDNEMCIELGKTYSKIAILSIHPEYYGWRLSERSAPTL